MLVNGIRQGAKTKRRDGEPLGSKSRCVTSLCTSPLTLKTDLSRPRSRICKLALLERHANVALSLGMWVVSHLCPERC